MTDPTDRRFAGGGPDPLERELRRTLAARAADAPDAQPLIERLLAAGAEPGHGYVTDVQGRHRSWRALGTPLVAAACVAAIVGIVLAIVQPGHSDHGPDAGDTPSLAVPSVPSTGTSVPATPSTSAPVSRPSTTSPTTSAPDGAAVSLRSVRVADLTFQRADSGWALASADCLVGPGRCTAVLRTTNGTDWTAFPNSTQFDVPGVSAGCPATTCVTHIRFANDSVGYAFGPQALYMTRNGGQSWDKQAGGADALETLDGNVIRVSAIDTDTPSLLTAKVGGTSWTSHPTSGFPSDSIGVSLSRSGHSAILAFSRYDMAKGNGIGQSGVVLRSGNDGATWTASGDPCPDLGAGYSDILVTATTAADNSVVVDCAGRSTADTGNPPVITGHTITSTDGGATFDTPTAGGKLPPARFVGAASSAVQLVVPDGGSTLYRSTDRGDSWTPVAGITAADVEFLGFESATEGRLVTDGGRTVWTTRNAGATWTRGSL